MAQRHALVAGATGIVGNRVAERLHDERLGSHGALPAPAGRARCRTVMLSVDLTDRADCRAKLARPPHRHARLLCGALRPSRRRERIDRRQRRDAHEPHRRARAGRARPAPRPPRSRHQVLRAHAGTAGRLPLTEESPARTARQFLFRARRLRPRAPAAARPWTYSTSRPHTFCDPNPAEPRNAALLIAVHASLARALRTAARLSRERGKLSRAHAVHVRAAARARDRVDGIEPRCANQSYNITNGDSPRWSELWAAFCGVFRCGSRRRRSTMRLADHVADKDGAWQKLVRAHGLQAGTAF